MEFVGTELPPLQGIGFSPTERLFGTDGKGTESFDDGTDFVNSSGRLGVGKEDAGATEPGNKGDDQTEDVL